MATTFAMTPQQIGVKAAAHGRSSRIPYYTLDFDPGQQDMDFSREAADEEFVASMIARVRERWLAREH